MKPNNPKFLTSTVRRPQSVRISRKAETVDLSNKVFPQLKPKAKPKLIVQFAASQKIVKSSQQPFLWQQLVLQNTQLKNTINQLKNESKNAKEQIEDLKKQIKRINKSYAQQSIYSTQEIHRLTNKNSELQKVLSQIRLRQSQLKYKIQLYQQQKKQVKDQVTVAKSKTMKMGEMRTKMYEIKQQNRMLSKKTSQNLTEIFENKFPTYYPLVFKALNMFKKMQKIQKSSNYEKLNKLLKFIFGPVIEIGKKVFNLLCDWVKCCFFGKVAYHPQHTDLVEVMLDKWKSSSNLAQQLQSKNHQLSLMQKNYLRLVRLHQSDEQFIQKLQTNNESINYRNQRLQQVFQNKAHDFAFIFLSKLKRYEQEMKQDPDYRDQQYINLPMLVNPQYLKIKQLVEILKTSVEVNRNLRKQLQEERRQEKQQFVNDQIQLLKEQVSQQKEKRKVVILKKNVFGYWIDPNFTSSVKPNKKNYKKSYNKATQTVNETQILNRLFFSVIVFKAKLRSVALKFDPYVRLQYSSNQYKTSVKSGKQPVWNQTYIFQKKQSHLNLTIFDKQKLGRDTIFGLASVDLSKIFLSNSEQQIKIQLQLKNQKGEFIGKIWLGIWMLAQQQVIHIRQIEGNFTKQKDIISEMDPYCIFKTDNKISAQTLVCRKGGLKPIWRQQFLIYINDTHKLFITDVKDQDVLADDEIGSGSLQIQTIPYNETQTIVTLLDDEQEVGTIKFKIYKRKYLNYDIKKKQPYLVQLYIKNQKFFMIQSAKVTVSRKLIPSFYYTVSYNDRLVLSSINKGKQVFFKQSFIFKINQQTNSVNIQLKQKNMIGDDTNIMSISYDASQNINNNYSDVETIQSKIENVDYSCRFKLLEQVEVIYIKQIKLDVIKSLKDQVALKIKVSDKSERIYLQQNQGEYMVIFDQNWQIYINKQSKTIDFSVQCNDQILGNGSINKSSILTDFLSESIITLTDKKSIMFGKITMIMGRHTFKNDLSQKIKIQTLDLGKRQYFSLLVHKATLTRDTQLFGTMQCYMALNYLKEYQTSISKRRQPIWNQTFIFYVQPDDIDLKFRVMDKQSMKKDDLVGSGQLNITNIIAQQNQQQSITSNIIFQQQICGKAYFSLTSIPLQIVVVIELIRAQIYKDTDWIGKIDPYAVISHNNQTYFTTQVLNEKGQNPEWKVKLQVQITDPQKPILIRMYDKDLIGKDDLGTAQFSVSDFTKNLIQHCSPLLKKEQQLGMVYLKGGSNQFIGKPKKHHKLDIPNLFEHLNLIKFTLVDLKSKQPHQFSIKYSYPFDKQIIAQSPSSNMKYNYQQYLNIKNQSLSLNLYKPNLLKGLQFKYKLQIDLNKYNSQFCIDSIPVVNSKSKQLGTLRYAIQKVNKCWVVYIKKIKLQLNQGIDQISLIVKSSVDSYEFDWKQNQDNINDFWIFTTDNVLIEIKQKSMFSTQSFGIHDVDIDLFNVQALRWRDFEIQKVGKISMYCSKFLYQNKFRNTSKEINDKDQVINMRLLTYSQQSTSSHIINPQTNMKIHINNQTLLPISLCQQFKFSSSNFTIQTNQLIKNTSKNSTFLINKKKRVGLVFCEPISQQQSSYLKIVIKDLRIKSKDGSNIDSLKLGNRTFSSQTKIGQCWYYQQLISIIKYNQQLKLSVENQNNQQKIKLQFKQVCLFQNMTQNDKFQIAYLVSTIPCSLNNTNKTKYQIQKQTDYQLFQISQIELNTPNNTIGSGTLSVFYQSHQFCFNIVNGSSKYILKSQSVLERKSECNYVQFIINGKLKAKCKINIQDLLEFKSSVEHEIQGQIIINEGGYNIGSLKAKLRHLEKYNYKQIKINNIIIANQFTNNRLIIKSTNQKIQLELNKNQGQFYETSVVRIFQKQPQLYIEGISNNKQIGQNKIQTSKFCIPLQKSMLNGLIEGQIFQIHNTFQCNTNKMQINKPIDVNNILYQFKIKDIFIENMKESTFYFSINCQQEIFYSPFYQTNNYYYSKSNFSAIVEQNKVKLQLWSRQDGNKDKLLGQTIIKEKQKMLTLQNKNQVIAVATIEFNQITNNRQYVKIDKVKVNNLRSTQLLVEMQPYLLIEYGQRSYRTSISKGQNNISWKLNFYLQNSNQKKVKVTIIDRDWKYDDNVGFLQVTIKQLLTKQDYHLTYKQKQAGSISIVTQKTQLSLQNKQIIIKPSTNISQYQYLRMNIKQVIFTNKKFQPSNPYLKIVLPQQIKYYTPLKQDEQKLLFNATLQKSNQIINVISVSLCSLNKKQQKVFYVTTVQISKDKQQNQIMQIFNSKKQHVADMIISIVSVFKEICSIKQVKMFTPGRIASAMKSFSILTNSQFYESRQVNSNDNMVGYYDQFGLINFTQAKLNVLINSRSIGETIIKVSDQDYFSSIIMNQKLSQKGLIFMTLQKIVFQGKTVSRIMYPLKYWFLVKIIQAETTRDVELFSKMDLYCKIQKGQQKHKTSILDNIGNKGVWNEQFIVGGQQGQYYLGLWDQQVTIDRVVGETNVVFSKFEQNQQHKVPILYKNKQIGSIKLTCKTFTNYMILSNFRVLFQQNLKKIKVMNENQSITILEKDTFQNMNLMMIEVPLLSDKIVLSINQQKHSIHIQELKQRDQYVLVVNGYLMMQYHLFMK